MSAGASTGRGAPCFPRSGTMDVTKAVKAYIERIVKEVQGMKILLLDDNTVRPCP